MNSEKALKILLMENDVILADVARSLGVTRGNITNVLKGRYRSARVLETVARRVGMKPAEFASQFISRKAA